MRILQKRLSLALCSSLTLLTVTACDPSSEDLQQNEKVQQGAQEGDQVGPEATVDPAQDQTGNLYLRMAESDEDMLKEIKTLAEKAEVVIDEIAVRRCIPAGVKGRVLTEKEAKEEDPADPFGEKLEPPTKEEPADEEKPPIPGETLEDKTAPGTPNPLPPPGGLDGLTEEELKKLAEERLDELSPEQIEELAKKHLDKLTPEQLEKLKEFKDQLSPEDLEKLEQLKGYKEKLEEHRDELEEYREELEDKRKKILEKIKERDEELNEAHEAPDACAESEWVVLNKEALKLDLLKLDSADAQALLSPQALPVGNYRGIRLRISDAQLLIGGMPVPLKVPSGAASGIKIRAAFEITADGGVDLDLGFDAMQALKEAQDGSWMLMPVLRPSKK